MASYHTIFVACPVGKALEVYAAVYESVQKYVYDNPKLAYPNTDVHKFMSFSIYSNSYNIFMTHKASSDFKDTYDGEKIQFLLGRSSAYMAPTIINAISKFGVVYERADENVSEEFVKVN